MGLESETRGLEAERLSTVAINAVNGWGDDSSLFGQSAHLAEMLGYPDSQSVQFMWGPRAGQDYLPGMATYSAADHVAGLTATVVDAPNLVKDVPHKVALLENLAAAASRGVGDLTSSANSGLRVSNLPRWSVERAIMREVGARSRAMIGGSGAFSQRQQEKACGAKEIKEALRLNWHPYRRRVVTAGVGAAGVAAALFIKSHTS